jgi:hypothetical protein
MNKLIIIGDINIKRCYLNISEEEAIKRYCEYKKIEKLRNRDKIKTISFDDHFLSSKVWI